MNGFTIAILIGTFVMAVADFRDVALKATNDYRQKHGAPPLTQDPAINKISQAYAEKLVKLGKMQHSMDPKYGENLYYSFTSNTKKPTDADLSKSAQQAVDWWYAEIKLYDYKKPGFSFPTSHFTALVWKSAKTMGFGAASDGKTTFVVANYFPATNMMRAFKENVLPPSG